MNESNTIYSIKSANTLIILGNGFDLNCKLASRFSDYFKEKADLIKNSIYKSDDEHICENIWDLLLYLAFYDENEFGRIFSKPNKKDILWMDVESLIEKIVLDTCPFVEGNPTYFSVIGDAFNFCEINLFDYSHVNILRRFFSSKNLKKPLYSPEYLYEQLLEFERQFKEYLLKQLSESRLYKIYAKRLLNQLVFESETFSLISFNYTMPFSSTLDHVTSCNIHGTVDSEVIVGFDSSKLKIDRIPGIRLSKSWQKMNLEFPRYDLPNKKYIKNIRIYGHSLGAQDYAYFHAIFDYYNLYDGDVILTFCYTNYGKTAQENIRIRNEYITKIHNLLNDYTINSGKESKVRTINSKLQIENRLRILSIPNM